MPTNKSPTAIQMLYEISSDVKNIKLTISEIKQNFQRLDGKVDSLEQTNAVLKSALGPNLEKLAPAISTAETIQNIFSNKKIITTGLCFLAFILTGAVGGLGEFVEFANKIILLVG